MSENRRPIIVFNGELDRIRTGYYPSLLYPKIGRISKSFIPNFTQVYYIHNFKGTHPGAFLVKKGHGSKLVWLIRSIVSMLS